MTEPQTPAVADAADLKALQGAAEGLDPGAVGMALALVGVSSFDRVPRSVVASVCTGLRACSRSWPPLPLQSILDTQR